MKFRPLCILNERCLQSLRILNIDGLDVAVEFLLCTFFVISLSRDSDTQSVRNALDTSLPDLLVQLGIETDVRSALQAMLLAFPSPANLAV